MKGSEPSRHIDLCTTQICQSLLPYYVLGTADNWCVLYNHTPGIVLVERRVHSGRYANSHAFCARRSRFTLLSRSHPCPHYSDAFAVYKVGVALLTDGVRVKMYPIRSVTSNLTKILSVFTISLGLSNVSIIISCHLTDVHCKCLFYKIYRKRLLSRRAVQYHAHAGVYWWSKL